MPKLSREVCSSPRKVRGPVNVLRFVAAVGAAPAGIARMTHARLRFESALPLNEKAPPAVTGTAAWTRPAVKLPPVPFVQYRSTLSPTTPSDVPWSEICRSLLSKWMNDGSAGTVTFDVVTAAEAGAATTSTPSTAGTASTARRRDDMMAFPQRRRAVWNLAVGPAAA